MIPPFFGKKPCQKYTVEELKRHFFLGARIGMTKNQNPKKAALVLSTWGHLGTSGLIGEWESRSSDSRPSLKNRRNKISAQDRAQRSADHPSENP